MSFWDFFRKKEKTSADSGAVFVPMTTGFDTRSSDTTTESPTGTDTATTTDSGAGFFGGDGGTSGGDGGSGS